MALILDILTTAALLFIVAAGLFVIFGVLKIINFAHAAWLTLGAYATVVTTQMGVSTWVALPLAAALGALIGAATEVVVIRPLYRRSLDAILATWGLGVVIVQLITLGFGRDMQMPPALITGTLDILGTPYSTYRLFLVLAALVLGAGYLLVLDRTRLGLTARAVIMNEGLARALGIDTSKVRMVTFMLGSAVACVAGVLLTPLASVDPTMGIAWLTGAFMLVMVSGSSIVALAMACLVFGAAQVVVSTHVSPSWAASLLRSSARSCCAFTRKDLLVTKSSPPVEKNRRLMTRHGFWLVALGVIALALVLVGPLFLERFSLNVLTRSMIYAMIAISVDMLWGYTGILTFGQAAFFGVGAYATALVLSNFGGGAMNFGLALVLSITIPMALAAFVGWLSFYHGSTPLYASVISLVVPIVLTQVIFAGGSFTGSSSGLVGYPTMKLGAANYFRLAGFALIVFAGVAYIIVRSDAGRVLISVRDNALRASYLGVRTQRVQILLMTILGGVVGLAGFLYANAGRIVAPEIAGFGFGTQAIIWTALGGRGTIIGPAMGAIGIDYLGAQLSGVMPFLWQLLVGLLFVVMILFVPRGLAGLLPRRKGDAMPPALVAIPDGTQQVAQTPVLEVDNLRKAYGDYVVLDGINLKVRQGELVSVVGPNGAGKTTLLRCLSDGTGAIQGSVRMAGQNIAGFPPEKVVALGIGRKFQVASVFESMTVAECLRLARNQHEVPSIWKRADQIKLPQAAIDILTLTGLDQKLGEPVRDISHGMRQSLELAMVVAMQPRLILLDEPTAGLTKAERTLIGHVLKRLTLTQGYSAILIEHDLDFVKEISQRIVVLHQGRLVMDGQVEEVVNSELVRSIYSGAAHD